MKIAVSAEQPGLDAAVDPRFGRCRYFVIVDAETMENESLENAGEMAGGGAGVSTAQLIAGKGIETLLTGNCGPNAFKVLEASKINVVTGMSGTVREAVENFKTGKFNASTEPNVGSHFGGGRQGRS